MILLGDRYILFFRYTYESLFLLLWIQHSQTLFHAHLANRLKTYLVDLENEIMQCFSDENRTTLLTYNSL